MVDHAKEVNNNKHKIFDIAVKLFAQYGYCNVSVRDISSEVGIKASSIYNHYENKEAILEAIFDYYVKKLEDVIYPDFNEAALNDPEEFLKKSLNVSMILFRVPLMNDIIKIITKEQLNNKRIRDFLLSEMIEKPHEKFKDIFAMMIKNGQIKAFDPVILAKEYQAFSVYQYFVNSILIDSCPLDLERDEREQEEHLKFFWNAIKK